MYGEEKAISTNEGKQQSKLPGPEIKWEHHKVHDKRAILTLFGAAATYGTADGSTIIASCSEGIIPIFFCLILIACLIHLNPGLYKCQSVYLHFPPLTISLCSAFLGAIMYWSWPLQCLSYTKSCHYYFFKDTPTCVGFV